MARAGTRRRFVPVRSLSGLKLSQAGELVEAYVNATGLAQPHDRAGCATKKFSLGLVHERIDHRYPNRVRQSRHEMAAGWARGASLVLENRPWSRLYLDSALPRLSSRSPEAAE